MTTNTELDTDLSETQRLLRKLRGLGQTNVAIAARLHVHRNAIDRWYRGERAPQTEFLVVEELKRMVTDVESQTSPA